MATYKFKVENIGRDYWTLPMPFKGLLGPSDSVVLACDGGTLVVARAALETQLAIQPAAKAKIQITNVPAATAETSGVRLVSTADTQDTYPATQAFVTALVGSIPNWGAAVATVAALKAVAVADRTDKQSRVVVSDTTGNRSLYVFDATVYAGIDDEDSVVVPTAGTGAWFKAADLDSREIRCITVGALAKDTPVCIDPSVGGGYDTTTKRFKVVAADETNPAKQAIGILPIAAGAGGVMFDLLDDYVLLTDGFDTSGVNIGTEVYLNTGSLNLTPPTSATSQVQVLGTTRTKANPGTIHVHIEKPRVIGTTNLQPLAVTEAKIAALAVTVGKLGDNAVSALKVATHAVDQTTPGIRVCMEVLVPAAAADKNVTIGGLGAGVKFKVIDVFFQKTDIGSTGLSITVKKGVAAITDVMGAGGIVADKAVVRAATIDDDNVLFSATDVLCVSVATTDAGHCNGICYIGGLLTV